MITKIKLFPFEEKDFGDLILEVPNAKFLMQWAGPKYDFPLSWNQMNMKIQEIENGQKKYYIFSAKNEGQTIGHVQLSIVDFVGKIGMIGSVLTYSRYRGNGFSYGIMSAIIEKAFNELNLEELRLGVFDFNLPAIKCYKTLGFKEYSFTLKARKIENEEWNLIMMKLLKKDFNS